jgi:hypothetical protein
MQVQRLVISLLAVAMAGCASAPESVSTEHKGKVLIVHHRRRTGNGLVDRIEAVNAKGLVTTAEVHVYDIGRLPHGENGIDEAHRYYRVVQSQRPDLMLPKRVSSGPRTVLAPPNYVPLAKDQRVNDAVAQALAAKDKLEAAAKEVEDRLKEDNTLRNELQAQIEENQRLQSQINAGFSTHAQAGSTPASTDAQKAAETAVDPLVQWGAQIQQQQ